jgi:hypothetical protein
MEVFIKGKQQKITLTQEEFRASGGQADVYVKGGVAYKVYHPTSGGGMIPLGKIQELSPLALPHIIKPDGDVLLDGAGKPVGYSMRAVERALPLVQTFTRAFRDREGLTPARVAPLVQKLRDGVQHVHDRGILIVDLNEMNFLVSSDLRELFFIDVDSYQTPHFPAPFLMESVRDRHCHGQQWSAGTDWFSFAVVSFQMFCGIHPFKGKHKALKGLDERMQANVSVLNAEVSVPAAALPFNVIPENYMTWYKAVFEHGHRCAPPTGLTDIITIAPAPAPSAASHGQPGGSFNIERIAEYESGEVVRFVRGFVLTTEGVYQGTRRLSPLPAAGCHLAVTPKLGHAILAWVDGCQVMLFDATGRQEIAVTLDADALMSAQGRLYVRRGSLLEEVEFVELGAKIVPHPRHIGNVMGQATQLFEGVAFQNLLGTYYASFFPEASRCRQMRIREIDGYRIIDARMEERVMMIVGEKAGRFDQFVLRFASDWESYDVRRTPDIVHAGLNFAVLDSGVCVHMTPAEEVEVFSHQKDSPAVRIMDDPAVKGNARLFANGSQALFSRGNSLYRLSLPN